MSTATPRTGPPGDEDLQALYNQVWAAFAEEPSPEPAVTRPGERDPIDSLYNAYATEDIHGPGGRHHPTRSISATAAAGASSVTSPRQTSKPLPTPQHAGSPASPTQGRAHRPLPRPPMPPSMSSMPEPRPFKHSSSESTPQLPRMQDVMSSSTVSDGPPPSRQRPATSDSKYGLPTHPRPPLKSRPDSDSTNTYTDGGGLISPTGQRASPSPSPSYVMQMPAPVPEISMDDTGDRRNGALYGHSYGYGSLTRQTSAAAARPPGALAPQIPGYAAYASGSQSPALPTSPKEGKYAKTNGRVAPPSPGYELSPQPSPGMAPSRSSSRADLNGEPSGHASSEQQYLSGVAYSSPSTGLGRSISNGSSSLSYGSTPGTLDRNSTTISTTYTSQDGSLLLGPSSSVATTVHRGDSTGSYNNPYLTSEPTLRREPSVATYDTRTPIMDAGPLDAGPSSRRPTRNEYNAAIEQLKSNLRLELHEEDADNYDDDLFFDGDSDSETEDRFVNFALLSHIAVRLRDRVPRGTHVKGGIPYPRAFTGKDIVSTIQSQIQRELLINHGISTNDRRHALQVARSLQSQLFFYEVEWGGRALQDGVEDVYMFLDDQEGGSEARPEREELPTGVITLLTKCYVVTCTDEEPCYAYGCPRRQKLLPEEPTIPEPQPVAKARDEWPETVPEEVLQSLPESEINRQTIIHKVISKEEQYVEDLDIVETLFIKPLRAANPPIISPDRLDDFIDEVFGNILDLRECNRRLLENLYVRQREHAPVIQRIGDVFLDAATEFRLAYPTYVGHLPLAEKRMKDEMENNMEFRLFLEQTARQPETRRLDLKHFLNRPSEHLQKYPVLLEAIHHETAEGNPDADFLMEAIQAIKNLQNVAQLKTFQTAMCKGPTAKFEWHNLVPEDFRKSLPKDEQKRQLVLFELIKGEMAYVKDLRNIDAMYIRPLRAADPPVIPPQRLEPFIDEVFHNYTDLLFHHHKLLEALHEIQREEHPLIRSVTAPILDCFLNAREAYLEYVPNYPIAEYRIDDEMAYNPRFKQFVEQATRHPDADRLPMKNFIYRPIPRLLRYPLLLKDILKETPPEHEDQESIPQLLDVVASLAKETEPGVASAKQKVELWRYNTNLVFKPGETVDMDLLNENRSLIHAGKLLRQPDTGFEWSGWSELFVLLFDNYLVMTKTKEKDGVVKYHVNRRPIPLDLLTLANFTDPPAQRGTGLLRGLRGGERHGDQPSATPATGSPETPADARAVYPCTIHHNGRLGGLYTLYADTAQARNEWKQKLEEALGLRKVVQESNKVFEIETLSADTFLVPSMMASASNPSWNENSITGKVTCSIPFTTADGRALVAIGCAEGVWIGFRHDSRSMRRVLHLKMVTQCAMLEDFGIFLVLADKSLFAYHIEALVPSSPQSAHTSQTPQKLSGNRDVHFFSVGNLGGRTLVIYMKKKGLDSVFRVLEPVVGNINERTKAPMSLGSRFGLRTQRSEWFRVYRDFFLPSESFDLIFLKAKIAILCTKGFEIMDLTDFKSATVPQREDPRLEKLAKRCESCRPIGMFRSSEDEFLLCYDEFGLYVDRHGDPSRSIGTIEWEGTAERVAWHPPYVLLFDTRFIEVRHVETGRLCQIIPGNDIRCIWDGRGTNASQNLTAPGPDGWQENGLIQDARVHGVMNSTEPMQPGPGSALRPTRAVAQHVFELIPTVPLYLPGSLSSPSQSTYFNQQSNSPPQSPRLNPSAVWR